MSAPPSSASPAPADAPKKRRGYRACVACRERKMKCDLGDIDAPTDGPCRRCRREMRPCVFSISQKKFARKGGPPGATFNPDGSFAQNGNSSDGPTYVQPIQPNRSHSNPHPHPPPAEEEGYSPPLAVIAAAAANVSSNGGSSHRRAGDFSDPSASILNRKRPRTTPPPIDITRPEPEEGPEEEEEVDVAADGAPNEEQPEQTDGSGNVLLSSSLHNPSDALRMLAHASVLKASARGGIGEKVGKGWADWPPVKRGMLTKDEAEQLLRIFEADLHPLYPILSSEVYHASHFPKLLTTESLLLGTLLCIASRYSAPPPETALGERCPALHAALAQWVQSQVAFLTSGALVLRDISSVESLLLLSEWPPVFVGPDGAERDEDDEALSEADSGGKERDALASVLEPSNQFDSLSWSFIGCAVRLAQELGIDNQKNYTYDGSEGPFAWLQERSLRTWIYCFEADRGVSVRLGRNAVVQSHLSSQWWERVCVLASQRFCARGFDHAWAEPMPQGFTATIMGTIHERLYPQREITRAILKTGHWETFLRSLSLELQHMQKSSESILKAGGVSGTLLQISFDYIRLYGNAIGLRALQERFQRRLKSNDVYSVSATLLNLAEGPYVFEAITAAQSILRSTVMFLHPQGHLKRAPVRIFQRILFACTFLFKALAVGCVEHGSSTTLNLVGATIDALEAASLDKKHLASGFAALLRRLQNQFGEVLGSSLGVVVGSEATPDGTLRVSRATSEGHQGIPPNTIFTAGYRPHNQGFPNKPPPARTNSAPNSGAPPQGSSLAGGAYPLPAALGASPAGQLDEYSFSPDLFTATSGAPLSGSAPAQMAVGGGTFFPQTGGPPLEWGVSHELGAVAKEQDLLLSSIWNDSGTIAGAPGGGAGNAFIGGGGGLNLVGTLFGDGGFGIDF